MVIEQYNNKIDNRFFRGRSGNGIKGVLTKTSHYILQSS